MELYSWKPVGADWHFSLLPGTNRNKSEAEVKDAQRIVVGMRAIEDKLSTLAEGENVFWCNLSRDPVPKSISEEIAQKCLALSIHLRGPSYYEFREPASTPTKDRQ